LKNANFSYALPITLYADLEPFQICSPKF